MPLDYKDREWLEEKFEQVHARMDDALHGPKGEPHKGIHVRMDRLERIILVIIWVTGAAITGTISALAKSFGNGSSPPPSHP